MPTQVLFRPLYGINDNSCVSYLLELDNFRILLDCGWNNYYDVNVIRPLIDIASTIDLVLISNPDLAHIGALPYLVSKCGLNAPVYGTIPVHRFGQIFLYDSLQSQLNQRDFDLFTLDEIDYAMTFFNQLTYAQKVSLDGKGSGIEFMPLCAGHMIGGSIWHITKHVESILYAVDYNNRVEKHLSPSFLSSLSEIVNSNDMNRNRCFDLNMLKTPTVMITDAWNARSMQKHTETRNKEFIQAIISSLRDGGDVLIPVDTAGRVLELLLLIEDNWNDRTQKVIFLSHVSFSMIEFAKTQIEWLEESYVKKFCDDRVNAFYLKNIICMTSLEDLDMIPKPRVILATNSCLTVGFSNLLFPTIATSKSNCIILTERSAPGTITRLLYTRIQEKNSKSDHENFKPNDQKSSIREGFLSNDQKSNIRENFLSNGIGGNNEVKVEDEFEFEFSQWHRIPLSGKELDAYLAKKKVEEEQNAVKQKQKIEEMMKNTVSEDESQVEVEDAMGAFDLWRGFDLTSEGLTKLRARGLKAVFPYIEPKTAFDDYGQITRLEAPNHHQKVDYEMDHMEDEDEEVEDDQIPTKAIYETLKFPLLCKIKIFDFEGRADSRSIKKIISQVSPRQLILVHGTEECRADLASYLNQNTKSITTHMPSIGTTLDVSSNVYFLDAHIKHQDFSQLRFVSFGDYELALVNGLLLPPSPSNQMHEVRVRDNLENNEVLSQNAIAGMFVGDIQLKDVKSDLDSLGYKTEWKGKTLVINDGIVQVQKEKTAKGRSKLLMDGIMCDKYFQIRQILYKKLIVL